MHPHSNQASYKQSVITIHQQIPHSLLTLHNTSLQKLLTKAIKKSKVKYIHTICYLHQQWKNNEYV